MFQPTGFADLTGRRVGIFGYGLEGRAAAARLRALCDLVIVDDNPSLGDEVIATTDGGLSALATCDVVLKSPGIPRRRQDVQAIEASGVVVTSALNLWLLDVDRRRVVGITGSKGKSTTTALTTFFFQCLGESALRLGNIGQPPYDPALDTSHSWLVLEVSSFQAVDLQVAPHIVVVTALGSDHLDWHGSLEQYHDDKLSFTRASGEHLTLVADTPALHAVHDQLGGDVRYVTPDTTSLTPMLGLVGGHNNSNVALALTAVSEATNRSLDDVRDAASERASNFEPLSGRLTLVATETVNGGVRRFVDDGLATSVVATEAALEAFPNEPLVLIAGGFDRGVDYAPLAHALVTREPATALVAMGDAGSRLATLVHEMSSSMTVTLAATMDDAVRESRALLDDGVVLFSPAAPSFDVYQNWVERSSHFTSLVRESLRRA